MKRLLILFLRLYQLCISPIIGPSCRFYPTCSAYAIESIKTHGACKGVYLSGKRLLRCHPWCEGGIDPVPPKK